MGKPGAFKKINLQDRSITPFKVYKSWSYTTTASLDTSNIDRFAAIKPNPKSFSGERITLNTSQLAADSSSLLVNFTNHKEAALMWHSLNHLYYKRAGQPYETFGYADPAAIERTIFDNAAIISVPQKIFGESIKPGSVKLNFKNTQLNSEVVNLIDDGKGNLIDTALSSSISGEVLYLGFNSSTYDNNWVRTASTVSSSTVPLIFDTSGSITVNAVLGFTHTWDSDFSVYYSALSGSYSTPLSAVSTQLATSGKVTNFVITLDSGFDAPINYGTVDDTSYIIWVYNNTDSKYYSKSANILSDLISTGISITLSGDTSTNFDDDLLNEGFTVYGAGPIVVNTPIMYPISTTFPVTTNIYKIHVDTTIPDFSVTGKNILITPEFNIPYSSPAWGNAAYAVETGYIRIPNHETINFKRSEDFAIAFWNYRESASTTDSYLLSKRTTGIGNILNPQTHAIETGDVNYNASQYPFEILYEYPNDALYTGSGIFTCKQSNGSQVTVLTGSINIGETKQIVLQKTGSNFELYINGVLASSKTLPSDGNIYNNADIFIGSLGIDSGSNGIKGMRGAVDEFFIFNKGLTLSEIKQLSYTGSLNQMCTNTNAIGNVFYEHGMIVVSDPRSKYGTDNYRLFNERLYNYLNEATQSAYLSNFYLEFNSTITLYEHEYVCKLKEDEFNFTSNPTIRIDNNEYSDQPKPFVSEATFAPYITTLGLYSPNGELLAVGKLGTPIKKRNNVDLAIIVKFDI